MSLLRPLIRACAVAALRENTWAGSVVYDTDMTPLGEAVFGKANHPYIVVFTDVDDIAPVRGVAEIYNGDNRSLSTVIEVGVASSVQGTAPNSYVVKFSHNDYGMEWAVDVVCQQALGALIGNPQSHWGELFKRMVYKLRALRSRRGGQAGGVRFAARRLTLVHSTNYDIAPGVPLDENHPVYKFIELARVDTALGMAELADTVERLISGAAAPDWQQAQALLGVTARSAKKLVVDGAPLPFPEIETPPLDWSDDDAQPAKLDDVTLVETENEELDWPGLMRSWEPP